MSGSDMEVLDIQGGIANFRKTVDLIQDQIDSERTKYLGAVQALNIAATQTNSYLESIKSGSENNTEREGELSMLWFKAMEALQPVDPDLADKCLIKGQCWSNPKMFNDPEYQDIPLSVNYIFKETRKILADTPKDKGWQKILIPILVVVAGVSLWLWVSSM